MASSELGTGTILLWDFKLGTMWGDVKRTRIVVGGTRQFAEPAPTAALVMPVGNRSIAKLPQSVQSGDVDTVSVGKILGKGPVDNL